MPGRGILRRRSSEGQCAKKHVAFRGDCTPAAVWPADDWDRTSCSVSRDLSFEDLLELNEIQRDLARGADPRSSSYFPPAYNFPQLLSKVPVALLPLLPENEPSSSSSLPLHGSTSYTRPSPSPSLWSPPSARSPPPKPALAGFTFLPLFDETTAPPLHTPAHSDASSPVTSTPPLTPPFPPTLHLEEPNPRLLSFRGSTALSRPSDWMSEPPSGSPSPFASQPNRPRSPPNASFLRKCAPTIQLKTPNPAARRSAARPPLATNSERPRSSSQTDP